MFLLKKEEFAFTDPSIFLFSLDFFVRKKFFLLCSYVRIRGVVSEGHEGTNTQHKEWTVIGSKKNREIYGHMCVVEKAFEVSTRELL